MPRLPRSYRRLLLMLLALPVTLFLLAFIYQAGMARFEGQPRTLLQSLEWAAETLTTTGYGRDTGWTHPMMQAYVITVQFIGLFTVFLFFPVFIIPFFEERFEARLPNRLPVLKGQVLIYRYGPAVASFLSELDRAGIPVTIFEEDELLARRLRERGRNVVHGNLEEEDPDLSNLVGARGMVLNGQDNNNALMALAARHHGYAGPMVALVEEPIHRPPLLRAGATAAFTAEHVLAASLAARASARISPRVAGASQLGQHLDIVELRLHADSPLVGKTIAQAGIRAQTGATIIGLWSGGVLIRQPPIDTLLEAGSIMVVVGSGAAIARLASVATASRRVGPMLVVGTSPVAVKVTELLRDAGEEVVVLDSQPGPGVDLVGDPVDTRVLDRAGARAAQAVVLSPGSDSATIFIAAVIRSFAPDVVMVAGASRIENLARIHRAGVDFALSVGQVAGQMLTRHILGLEAVSLEQTIKLAAARGAGLAARPLEEWRIRERTGCSVVAVERGDEVLVEFPAGFRVAADDTVYLTGTQETIAAYFKAFPDTGARSPAGDPASAG